MYSDLKTVQSKGASWHRPGPICDSEIMTVAMPGAPALRQSGAAGPARYLETPSDSPGDFQDCHSGASGLDFNLSDCQPRLQTVAAGVYFRDAIWAAAAHYFKFELLNYGAVQLLPARTG